MTPLQLLDALEAFCEARNKRHSFTRPGGPQEWREQGTRGGGLQNAPAEQNRANGAGPYLLLQYIKSTDTQEQGQDPESECTVRIVAATYSEDESEGAMCVFEPADANSCRPAERMALSAGSSS